MPISASVRKLLPLVAGDIYILYKVYYKLSFSIGNLRNSNDIR